MTKMKVTTQVEIKDEFLHSIFVTALEGGIGYWSECTKYRWSLDKGTTEDLKGFHARIVDVEENKKHTINRNTIIKGLRKLLTGGKIGIHPVKVNRLVGIVMSQDAGEIDSGDADCIVQLGLFGEVIYG